MRYAALQEYVEWEKILLTLIPILSVLTDFDNVRTFYKYFVYC